MQLLYGLISLHAMDTRGSTGAILRLMARNCHEALLRCPVCEDFSNVYGQQHLHYEWALNMQCSTSGLCSRWVICTVCNGPRTHYTTTGQTTRHHKRCHKDDASMIRPCFDGKETSQCNSDGSSDVIHDNLESELPLPDILQTAPSFSFSNGNSEAFFMKDSIRECGGAQYLVGWSYHHLSDISADKAVPMDEVQYHMLMAYLVSMMPRSQVHLLGRILGIGQILQQKVTFSDSSISPAT
jgi:hypothetical protein